jgi:hypothetical protein
MPDTPESPDATITREKHAAAADPHESPDQKLAREKRGHVRRDRRKPTTTKETTK